MKSTLLKILLALGISITQGNLFAQQTGKLLILNFDCSGTASSKSGIIGDSLRMRVSHDGGELVSRDLFNKLIQAKKFDESDLNYMLKDLKTVTNALGAKGAVFGHVSSSDGLLTLDLKYLDAADSAQAVLYNSYIFSSMNELLAAIPELSRLIISPDKATPRVISVFPPPDTTGVGQFVEMVIKFSKPMNPSTFSIHAKPEKMWSRYGEVIYDPVAFSFKIKLHLYPEIKYEFQVNSNRSMGFKDLSGNPAEEFIWNFTTGR